jgi:steroid delta-isomerase-like uncharacterized protein
MGKHTEIMNKAWEIFEKGQWQRLEEIWTPISDFRMPGGTMRGPAELRAMCEAWWGAFPDLKHNVIHEIESGDTYACELAMTGTHTGTMHTPNGDIPATGKTVKFLSCDYVQIKDGKIVSWHAYTDMMSFLAQLGVG